MPYHLPVIVGIGAAIGTVTFFYHNRELIQDFIQNFDEVKTMLENKRAHRLAAATDDSAHTIYYSREMDLDSHDSDSELTETEAEQNERPPAPREFARSSAVKDQYESSPGELRNRMSLSMPSSADSTQSLDFDTAETGPETAADVNPAFESDYSIISEDFEHSDA